MGVLGLAPRGHRLELAAGHQVRVQEVGEGPPVLLIHGAGSSGAQWAPLIARLQGFRCLALDRPGCGLSQPVATAVPTATVEQFNRYAESLSPEVLDALAIDRAHVVSTSLGGYFAVLGAAAHSERVNRVVHHAYCFGAPIKKVPLVMRLGTLPGFEALSARMPPTRFALKVILRQIGLKRAFSNGRFTPELFEWFLALLPRHRNDAR